MLHSRSSLHNDIFFKGEQENHLTAQEFTGYLVAKFVKELLT